MIENHGEAAMRLARLVVEISGLVFKDPLSFKIPWARLAEKQELKDALLPMRDLNRQHLMKIKDEAVSKDDILSSIIRANGCSDDLSMEDLIDDYNTFLVAGMGTTSITMACAVWFLSMNPHVYETAVAEVDDVFGDRDQIEFEDVQKLIYIEMVIKETLRLKAPAFGTTRQCKNHGTSINGVSFPKGTQFYIPFHNIHLDSKYWKDPEVFDPERFSPASVKNIRPYTYMPFSTGPRNCVGKNFAMLKMKIVLANILKNFSIVNANPEQKELATMGNLTIRPINGVNVRIFMR
jgi:cytochrome P450